MANSVSITPVDSANHHSTSQVIDVHSIENKTYLNQNDESENGAGAAERYFVFCLLSFLAVIGTFGNIVVLHVFSRPSKRDRACPSASATVYLLALAVADLMTSVVVMPSTVYMELVQFRTWSNFLCKFYHFLLTSNIPFSSLVMVAIAVDRYICICHPLHQVTWATSRRARIVVGFLALVAVVLGMCVALMFSVHHRIPLPSNNSSKLFHEHDLNPMTSFTSTSHLLPAQQSPEAAPAITSTVMTSVSDFSVILTQPHRSAAAALTSETDATYLHESRENHLSDSFTANHHSDWVSHTAFSINDENAYQIPDGDDELPIVNTGYCGSSDIILQHDFQEYYVAIHAAMYPLCLLAVVILYGLIYRSVLIRRARRQRLRSPASPQPAATVGDGHVRPSPASIWVRISTSASGMWTNIATRSHFSRSHREQQTLTTLYASPLEVDHGTSAAADDPTSIVHLQRMKSLNDVHLVSMADANSPNPTKIEMVEKGNGKQSRSHSTDHRGLGASGRANGVGCFDHHKTLLTANLRTAAMLFVVTVVFVVCYSPAFLMSQQIVAYDVFLYYLYFVNSVANPVIYSFMNRYFRQELQTIVCGPIHNYYQRRNEFH